MQRSDRQVTGHRRARRWRPMWAAALAVTAASAFSGRADAAIYWTYNSVSPRGSHEVRGHIGRASLNGRHPNPRFITLKRKVMPWGVAVNRRHIFWTAISAPPVGIGRANLDGSGVDQGFTPVLWDDHEGISSGAHFGIAVAGGHIYWANLGRGTIGRSDLDGSNVNPEFITTPSDSGPSDIAVGGGYVFWANRIANTIGRANLDGSDPNPAFIVGARRPHAIVIARGHVYWGNVPVVGEKTVGRAKTDGTQVNHRFMRHRAHALAAKGRYIYGSDPDHIWRARLDGSRLKRHFIKLKSQADGLAVR